MNENTGGRSLGERVAALETMIHTALPEFNARLNHLDECVDGVKKEASDREKKWDKRWNIGLGIVLAFIVAAGSGTISLKSLLELMGKFIK